MRLFMELKEHLLKLQTLYEKRNGLLNTIQQNHIHNSNDELVFHRYKNKDNIWLREHIQRGIDKGKKWTQLLDNFPLPDKPFDIADIQDTEMKKCFMELEKIEDEKKVLRKYIRSTFEPTEINKQFDHILKEKYNHETMDHTNN